eukprot:TRINITY_DN3075_c0_g2_i1.p1 TRINITY_DN3075_c0_g2~~TRINITY_DN3075_c0_g2_i1.p1  ORF type:complete len:366 (-),score=64.94 TRINITY_DN3075_c0_g2_i1:886-1983(-)
MFGQPPSTGSSNPLVDVVQGLKTWWSDVGVATRLITYSSIFVFVASFIYPLNLLLANFPGSTILSIQLWRLLTAPFANLSLISLVFGLLVYLPDAAQREREVGTVLFAIDFLYLTVQIQLLFTIVGFILGLIFSTSSISSYNLWPLFLAAVVKLCLGNPEQKVRILILPITVKARYYPFGLLIFFCVFSGGIQLDLIVAGLVGYLHHRNLLPQLSITKEFVQRIEQSLLCRFLISSPSFKNIDTSVNFGTASTFSTGRKVLGQQFAGRGTSLGGESNRTDALGQSNGGESVEKRIEILPDDDSLMHSSEQRNDSARLVIDEVKTSESNPNQERKTGINREHYAAFPQEEETSNAEQFTNEEPSHE